MQIVSEAMLVTKNGDKYTITQRVLTFKNWMAVILDKQSCTVEIPEEVASLSH